MDFLLIIGFALIIGAIFGTTIGVKVLLGGFGFVIIFNAFRKETRRKKK